MRVHAEMTENIHKNRHRRSVEVTQMPDAGRPLMCESHDGLNIIHSGEGGGRVPGADLSS